MSALTNSIERTPVTVITQSVFADIRAQPLGDILADI